MARYPGAETIYEVAARFRERCLGQGRSLLWPEREAWTVEHVQALRRAMLTNPAPGSGTFLEKLRVQIDGLGLDVHRVAADVDAIYNLFPTFTPAAKRKDLETILGWGLAAEGEPPELPLVAEAFEAKIGSVGMFYSTRKDLTFAFMLELALRARQHVGRLSDDDLVAMANAEVELHANRASARNVLLHLLLPDRFERIASEDHLNRIAKAFAADAEGIADRTEALLAIREVWGRHLNQAPASLDFYLTPELKARWNPSPDTSELSPAEDALDQLAAMTFTDRDDLAELRALLEEKRQVVLEGPPGSGKTWLAGLLARWVAGLPPVGPDDPVVEVVQFHQSYGYEDFVQGIRPVTERGVLGYRVVPGIFTELCRRAEADPGRAHVLVIDEINRGNLSRIFGELLLLLEYRDRRVRLPQGEAGADAYLRIPPNLYLIGTMNSTDRSLALIDYALRRRFAFWRMLPTEQGRAPVLERWLAAQAEIDPAARVRLADWFVRLNAAVGSRLGPDYQVGHSYLMRPGIGRPEVLDRVWRREVRPLLEEYFHAARDRDQLIAELRPGAWPAEGPSAEATSPDEV